MPRPHHYGEGFTRAIDRLRRYCAVASPIAVKIVGEARDERGELVCGTYEATPHRRRYSQFRFVIRIGRELDFDTAIDTLVHEWAHCLDIEQNGFSERRDHRDSWGVCYARAYRAVHDTATI